MNRTFPRLRVPSSMLRRLALGGAAAAILALLSAPARADGEGGEGEGGGEAKSVEQEVRAQMEKVLRLMRENEHALLEAARAGGGKPPRVDVKPPDGSETPSMDGAAPAMTDPAMSDGGAAGMDSAGMDSAGTDSSGMDGAAPTPRERGDAVRRSLEELLEGVRRDGGKIPKELEELVRLIPTCSNCSGGPPDPSKPPESPDARKQDTAKPDDQNGEQPKDPRKSEDPAKKPEARGGKPPQGDAGDPAKSEIPPWDPSLPESLRREMTKEEIDKVPAEYRDVVLRYQKWLQEHSRGSSGDTGSSPR